MSIHINDPRDILIAPVVSEKSYGLLDEGKYTFLVDPRSNKTEIKIAIEQVFNVKVDSVHTMNRRASRGVPVSASASARTPSARSSRCAGAPSTSSARAPERRRRRRHGYSQVQADHPRAVVARRSPTSSRSPDHAGRSRWSVRSARAAAATTPAGSPPATSVVATSAPTASSTSVVTTRTASRPRSRTSSTTPTAPRGSRCCTTPTAKRYILAPNRLKQGDIVENGPSADIKPGNSLPLRNIPTGTTVHAIELKPGGGARSPAPRARRSSSWPRTTTPSCVCPSGEIRNVDLRCRATVGEVGNAEQSNINWGKAGRMRWKGKRPTVRGVAIDPVDHPHGGGEGKTSGGRRGQPVGTRPKAVPAVRTSRATSSSSVAVVPARSAEEP